MDEDIITLAEGSPGAMKILTELLQQHPDKFQSIVPVLRREGIRGKDMLVIYILCRKNMDAFVQYLLVDF